MSDNLFHVTSASLDYGARRSTFLDCPENVSADDIGEKTAKELSERDRAAPILDMETTVGAAKNLGCTVKDGVQTVKFDRAERMQGSRYTPDKVEANFEINGNLQEFTHTPDSE